MKEPPASRFRRKPTANASAAPSRMIKLICSFNGAFHFRPPSNKLRYIGGETRIVSVDRNIGLFKLLNKMSDLCPNLRSFSLKYQLPMSGRAGDPELDSETDVPLVSIASDEDVRCMIEEYDKLELYGKHARLWIFVCNDGDQSDVHYDNYNNGNSGFVKGNGEFWVDNPTNDALRGGAESCQAQFDGKAAKNPVKGVARFRYGDDSLRKIVLRQQLLGKQSEGIHNCGADSDHKYNHPFRDLAPETNASMPQGNLYQENMLGNRTGNANLRGSESSDRLVQYSGPRLLPLNPKDGNLHVETNSSTHCLSGKNFQVFGHGVGISNPLHSLRLKNMCDLPYAKQDSRILGQGAPSHLNRENIVPCAVVRALRTCNSQWGGNTYPAKSPFSTGGYQNGIRNNRCIMKESGNQRVYPYQVRSHRNFPAEMGNHRSTRLDGRLSAVKCYPGLRPNSTISKQGPSMRLYGSKQGGRTSMINSSLSKDNSSFSLSRGHGSAISQCGNSNAKDFSLPYHGEGVSVGNQSLLSPEAFATPSSCVEKTESQQDLLTGSPYEKNEVPYQSMYETITNELFTVDQQKVVNVSGLSNDLHHAIESAVECNTNLISTGRATNMFNNPKNGTPYFEVASSVDLLYNLSLSSSKGAETPACPSLASIAVSDSSLKPESNPLDIMGGQLSTGLEADKSNAVASNSTAPNAVSMEKDQEHEEDIQQDLLSGLSIDEKAETKEGTKCSKVIGGISSELAAFYTHLATRELQTIKNSDLEYIKELGSGAYGTVYYGKWKGSSVAIKRLKPSCFTGGSLKEDQLVADFWKEAHILGQLHHPNIVAFYGVVTDGPLNNLATVTEYMVNGSLKQVLRRKDRTIDRRKRIILAMDAAFGMEYLHEKNIVHFDLKSHNLLVNMKDPQRPVCKIGDLGLSKIKQRTLISGGVRGTIPWMAPELLHSKSNMVTEKVDVYSFGIVMWELLTGEEPYANLRSEEIIAGIIKGNLRPEIPSWCDPAWKSLMERCWSSDPESRPAFSEIAKELRTMSASMNIK
ncbi:serine/threonine-protein kinase EDR1-like isoform X4 [Manihot esculenta]|uniref:Uncharacterized protein n=2 Tax=Manihot esculenta TaxID=3983 RepID=A0ACB7GG18_MANES|nr:serine/threonine-protein kinase EDR1-like isoform X4 [Manihot esculenta]KAG8639273.1 hypothetical protein MANES_14G129528v8 [Manihot esculenta]KAG8639274.1 hypothetical protein MANES_14G129528v8 [Manihot esculenta]